MHLTPQESLINAIYSSVDAATSRELARLHREEGITPPCRAGCFYCCRFHIVTNLAEAHLLAQYVRKTFSVEQMAALRTRTHQWHAWDSSRPGRPAPAATAQADLSAYEHCCPLLVEGACSAYPARPMVCRTHYVSTHPRSCQAASEAASGENPPVVLTSVKLSASPFAREIRAQIENAGLDFARATMLLPQCLALEMGWDFAITP